MALAACLVMVAGTTLQHLGLSMLAGCCGVASGAEAQRLVCCTWWPAQPCERATTVACGARAQPPPQSCPPYSCPPTPTRVQDSSGEVITNRRAIAMRYLRGWFVIDLLATFPVDYILRAAEVCVLGGGRGWKEG